MTITSSAQVVAFNEALGEQTDVEGLRVSITASEEEKCERCWHHSEDVGKHSEHESLCGRCIENVEGAGEQRAFA